MSLRQHGPLGRAFSMVVSLLDFAPPFLRAICSMIQRFPVFGNTDLKATTVSTTPTLLDGGFETVGEGSHLAIFRVKILPQHSSRFFEGPISHVDKSDEAVKQLRQQAQNYPTIRENTIVRCSDGKPLLYFMKGGMLSGLTPDERRDLPEQSINAVRALTEVYRPPPPKKTDSRMQAEQRRIQSEKNGVFGRYVSYLFINAWK